jgi:hypothetical protein
MFQNNLIDLVEIEPGCYGTERPLRKIWPRSVPDLIIALCLLGNIAALLVVIERWLS